MNYYLLAQNVSHLNTLQWYAETSLLKTLAAKHKSSVSKMAARYKAKAITKDGPRKCLEARKKREGKPDVKLTFAEPITCWTLVGEGMALVGTASVLHGYDTTNGKQVRKAPVGNQPGAAPSPEHLARPKSVILGTRDARDERVPEPRPAPARSSRSRMLAGLRSR